MTKKISFEKKTAIIVCHDSMPGPPHETLRDYLLDHKIEHLLFIGHVNQYVKGNPVTRSYIKIYENGKLKKHIFAKKVELPEPFVYIHDIILTIYWTIKYTRGKIDYFIGLANLNAVIGILFKYLHKVEFSIYYIIDYVPQRFSNNGMNSVYHYLDKICAEQSNVTWNYGKGMIEAREKKWQKKFSNQFHVPHGVYIDTAIIDSSSQYSSDELVYMGTLYEQQGLQLVIDALPNVIKKIPTIHLTIIGIGPYRSILETRIEELHLKKYIDFVGFIQDPKAVDKIIARSALGIATYKNNMGFVMYTEPGKVKRYLSCGTPVIITKGTPLAEDISIYKCGVVSDLDVHAISSEIISVLAHPQTLKKMRNNAVEYSKKYTWEKIYTQAFQSLV